jgi:hypothetical protein
VALVGVGDEAGPSEAEALGEIDAVVAEQGEGLCVLDTLGNRLAVVGHEMGHEVPRSPADLSQARFRQNRLKPGPT